MRKRVVNDVSLTFFFKSLITLLIITIYLLMVNFATAKYIFFLRKKNKISLVCDQSVFSQFYYLIFS